MDLLKYTLRIADSSIILGQRLSSWCSKGPTLEEDIALSNLSLDLFGQANALLEYASELDGKDVSSEIPIEEGNKEVFNIKNNIFSYYAFGGISGNSAAFYIDIIRLGHHYKI